MLLLLLCWRCLLASLGRRQACLLVFRTKVALEARLFELLLLLLGLAAELHHV